VDRGQHGVAVTGVEAAAQIERKRDAALDPDNLVETALMVSARSSSAICRRSALDRPFKLAGL